MNIPIHRNQIYSRKFNFAAVLDSHLEGVAKFEGQSRATPTLAQGRSAAI
jgi:hypothetical protein